MYAHVGCSQVLGSSYGDGAGDMAGDMLAASQLKSVLQSLEPQGRAHRPLGSGEAIESSGQGILSTTGAFTIANAFTLKSTRVDVEHARNKLQAATVSQASCPDGLDCLTANTLSVKG